MKPRPSRKPRSASRTSPKSAGRRPPSLEAAQAAAAAYARGSRARSTWRAYESDWQIFSRWCRALKLRPLPANSSDVALFLATQADEGLAPATLQRRLAAIRLMHLAARLPSPHDAIEIAEVLRGIRRRRKRPAAQKAPAVDHEVQRMVDQLDPTTRRGLRDRALLLLGFAGAFRRSELVALDVAHVQQRKEGLAVRIASSKTDQEGKGQMIAIPRVPGSPYCPVGALIDWRRKAVSANSLAYFNLARGRGQ